MPISAGALSSGYGNLPGNTTNYNPAYGGSVLVPAPGTSAGAAIGANRGNLGAIYGLGSGLNQFNQQELLDQIASALPGYQNLVGAAAHNTGDLLAGRIPQDVINQMAQQGAERGVAIGSPGSPNANAAYLAAIGRTSLDLQNRGDEQLTSAIARTPRAPLFNTQSMLITPDEQQQAAAAANLYASAPQPAAAAAERLRIARTAGTPAAARPMGGFMGVDRGGGGAPMSPVTPFDHAGGTVGPYYGGGGGYTPQGVPAASWNAANFHSTPHTDGSSYAQLPVPYAGANAQWDPTIGLFVDQNGMGYDTDGTPIGPIHGAQQYGAPQDLPGAPMFQPNNYFSDGGDIAPEDYFAELNG